MSHIFARLFKNKKPFRLARNTFIFFIYISLCLTFSWQVSAFQDEFFSNFDQVVVSIEQETKPQKRATQLALLEKNLSVLTIKQQIIYYKLLAVYYIDIQQYQLALRATAVGLDKTKELASPSYLISELLYKQGLSKQSLGYFDDALVDYKLGLETAKSLSDHAHIARGLILIGALYTSSDRYENALEVLDDAYHAAEKTNSNKLKGAANSQLGILYSLLEQNNRAIQYYQQAHYHYQEAGDLLLAHLALIDLARLHATNRNYQGSVDIYLKMLEDIKLVNSLPSHEFLFNVYLGISWSYSRLSPDHITQAYNYLLKAKEHIQYVDKPNVKLQFYSEQAYVLFGLKKYQKALSSIANFERLITKSNNNFSSQKQAHLNLVKLKAEMYYQLEQYQSAYQASVFALSIKRSLKAQEQLRSITEVRLKLQAEQQDLEKKVLENKTRAQNITLQNTKKERTQEGYFLILASLLTLIFIWLLVKLIQGEKRLKKSSNTDLLTSIDNKTGLLSQGLLHLKFCQKKQQPFSLVLFRLNNLKEINNSHGYQTADELLKFIAKVGQKLIRKSDVFGRFSGNEFIIMLPTSSQDTTLMVAKRFKETLVQQYATSFVNNPLFTEKTLLLEVSSGIVSKTYDEKSQSDTLQNTEKDLTILINQAIEIAKTTEVEKILLGLKQEGSS
ncbi:MAG: diguanylate cyclase [Colwellia sp.]